MKRAVAIVSSLLLSLSCSGTKQPSSDAENVSKALKEVLQVEFKLATAIQRKDTDTLNHLYNDDYLLTGPDGRVVNKADLVASVGDATLEEDSLELDDLRLRLFDNVAILTGRAVARIRVRGEDYSGSYRGTGIFLKRQGRWEVIGVHVGPDRRCRS
jgi:ketosteroid isomerase-like protein